MPFKRDIKPTRRGKYFCVIIPKDQRTDKATEWFTREGDAKERCKELMRQRGGFGARLAHMDPREQARVLDALALAGDSETLLDAVKFWREQKPSEQVTLKELAVRCVASKEKRSIGGESHYTKCLRRSLQLFISERESELAHTIQPHHVEAFINSKPEWTQFTKRTYLRDVTTMFSFAVKNGFCRDNPALKVERPEMLDAAPQILMVNDAERLLRSAERTDRALVQYLALCLFGGLRPSEAFRIQPENIKSDAVEVFGKKVRARNRRLVTLNPTLKAWLAKYPGDFSPVNLQRRILAVRNGTAVAKCGPVVPIRWTQDCMRHSFVSYHYAMHQSAKATAMEAGHSESVLFQHYRELVRRDDAERFWGILPL